MSDEQSWTPDQAVKTITIGSRTFLLLGTAHVSSESVAMVEHTIANEEIDHVCIEIDEGRYRSVTSKKAWSQIDIFQIIRRKQTFLLLSNLILSSFQRRMGVGTGVTPGSEMVAAVREAQSRGIPFSLGDRPVAATLRRAWAKTGFWGKNKLMASMIASAFSQEKVTEEDLQQLQQQSELESMLQELADYLPAVKEVLIDERDQYLAKSIWDAPGERILAVVGAGHVPGIKRWLTALSENADATTRTTHDQTDYHLPHPHHQLIDKRDLEVIPPPGPVRKVVPYIIPAVVVALIMWGFFRGGLEGGLTGLTRWVLVNGTLSCLGAIIALAHPVTIVVSFLAAPLTSMNPTVGVGFVTGLLEAVLRKPRVADFENLNNDIMSVRASTATDSHASYSSFFSQRSEAPLEPLSPSRSSSPHKPYPRARKVPRSPHPAPRNGATEPPYSAHRLAWNGGQ